jgi:2,3-bisphosphoglycerate-independent phosphoglycerate mutase
MSKKVLLTILDGWGLEANQNISAISQAQTPYMDHIWANFPHAQLETSGLAVGLPAGQMGNSEVGHTNLGAGRVVYQNLVRINLCIENKQLGEQEILKKTLQYAKENNKKVHLVGLCSDGGVHAHIKHLKALMDCTHQAGLGQVFVHAFTDGRDCDPHSGKAFIADILAHAQARNCHLATIVGRYYAMDRDQRWDRLQQAYQALVHGQGEVTATPLEAMQAAYDQGISDEFMPPIIIPNAQNSLIADGDVVICFNFRTDRGRQLIEVLSQKDFPEFGMKKLKLNGLTFTQYSQDFKEVGVIFEEENLTQTLGEVLAKHQKTQIRIAETEKYPHVSFFFSGGQETPFEGETRLLCPSPKEVATYDQKPEMAAYDLANTLVPHLENQAADFVCLNFANADMVGHTGDFQAAIKACETVDQCLQQVATAALQNGYTVLVLADHGNADVMKNPDGSPNTQHSLNLVPLVVLDAQETWQVKDGKLGDIAPSILNIMQIPVPEAMTGNIIISK